MNYYRVSQCFFSRAWRHSFSRVSRRMITLALTIAEMPAPIVADRSKIPATHLETTYLYDIPTSPGNASRSMA